MSGMALYYNVAIQVVFFLVLIVCAVTEVRENKIYNVVTYPAILMGLGLNYLWRGVPGMEIALMGAGVGFTVYLMFYLMKGLGPGDVKLGAALGALKGFPFILDVIIWAAIFGFVMAIFTMGGVAAVTLVRGARREIRSLRSKGSGDATAEEAPKEADRRMPLIPYGTAICLGAAVTFICRLPNVNMGWVNW